MSRSATRLAGATLGALLMISAAGCGSDDPDPASGSVSISDPWSRRPVDGQSSSAFYGVITNDGDDTVTAVAATASVSDSVELHEVVMNDDGTMTMRERDGGYEIAAGESITLEPGGLHVMLLDIDPATYPDEVDVTLEFDDGSTLDVTGEVREVESMDMDMDHDHDDHDDHDHDDHDHGDDDHEGHDDEMEMDDDS